MEKRSLSKRHFTQLHIESGIAPDIIEGRGYRTIRTVEELRKVGFRPRAYMRPVVPGLLLPVHGPRSGPVSALYRPDQPWRSPEERRLIKYAAPRRALNHIDVHPSMRDTLVDTSRAAFITEGHKKADAATSRGLLCLGISGVDNFRYRPRDEQGRPIAGEESVPCDEWADIPMDRDFVIVYDSDLAANVKVSGARQRLTRFLYRHGAARVFWADLPGGQEGAKTGLDDWFVAGGTVADLRTLVRHVPVEQAGTSVKFRSDK